jgi:hypothetical protein
MKYEKMDTQERERLEHADQQGLGFDDWSLWIEKKR